MTITHASLIPDGGEIWDQLRFRFLQRGFQALSGFAFVTVPLSIEVAPFSCPSSFAKLSISISVRASTSGRPTKAKINFEPWMW